MDEKVKNILQNQLEILAKEAEVLHGKTDKEVMKRVEKLCAIEQRITEIAETMKVSGW